MPAESRTLIRRAFEEARKSGRPDWHRMSVAVLKNRILDLTERSFRESDYGAPTFGEFVRNHDDILALDATQRPPVAILKGVSPAPVEAPESTGTRIRSDLWQAVLDFSSGEEYVWDVGEGVAKRVNEAGSSGLALPTITADQFCQWKKAFAEEVDEGESDERLSAWVGHRLPASFLPLPLRHRWNGYLKAAVRRHLLAWFEEQHLVPPSDILEEGRTVYSAPGEELRKRLIASVRAMTPEELERVQIPSSALLRLKL